MDVLKFLEREDKWFLGGGGALIFAPENPLWLHRLGFWDQAYFVDHVLQPLFTVTLLQHGEEVDLKLMSRSWQPHRLEQVYSCSFGQVIEHKVFLRDNTLASTICIVNDLAQDVDLDVVVWTAQLQGQTVWDGLQVHSQISDCRFNGSNIQFIHKDINPKGSRLGKRITLGADRIPQSFSIDSSQYMANHPHWHLTPYYERFGRGALGELGNQVNLNGVKMELLGIADTEIVYMGTHYDLSVGGGDRAWFTAKCIVSLDDEGVLEERAMQVQAIEQAGKGWKAFFDQVPALACSDKYLEKYYWYRWYGLRLNEVNFGRMNLPYPFVTEGPNPYYFRRHISYSAFCHMLETRWYANPSVAQGSLLNFIHGQSDSGLLPATLGATENLAPLIYHANWGWSVRQLHSVHPDDLFLSRIYEPLAQYARAMDETRDHEHSGLYDVQNQFETGQEYSSRYFFADPDADKYSWYDDSRNLHLKGVDSTVYMYELKKTLSWMARLMNRESDALKWRIESERIRDAVLRFMWDAEEEMFFDYSIRKQSRSPYKAITNFYPYMTDIVGAEHIAGLWRHLLNPDEFWTPFPVPTSSVDDPYFSAEPNWKGKRHICPWNGRVWPMANSHIVEALVSCGQRFDQRLLSYAAELLKRFVRMMFFEGDVDRPNCFEHYNPFTGKESRYRGVDDYQHSWVADLLIKYVAGIQPQPDGLMIAPLPGLADSGSITGVPWRGHKVAVTWGDVFRVSIDDQEVWEGDRRLLWIEPEGGDGFRIREQSYYRNLL